MTADWQFNDWFVATMDRRVVPSCFACVLIVGLFFDDLYVGDNDRLDVSEFDKLSPPPLHDLDGDSEFFLTVDVV